MKDEKTSPERSTPEKDTTQKSVATGKKAIKIAGETSGKPREQVEKEDKKDAENWRNEG